MSLRNFWREKLGYGIQDESRRRRSFFWTVFFVAFFPAIVLWYMLRYFAAFLATRAVGAWRDFHYYRPTLPRVAHSVRSWVPPADTTDIVAQTKKQALFAGAWLILAAASTYLAITANRLVAWPVMVVFALACVSRVAVHVATYRWMIVSSAQGDKERA